MEEDIKIWLLDQLEKMRSSIKEDISKINERMDHYVSHGVCDARRSLDTNEKEWINERMSNIDDEMTRINDSFNNNINKIRTAVWTLLGAIIGELIMIIINISMID